jgi:hypothetical protein
VFFLDFYFYRTHQERTYFRDDLACGLAFEGLPSRCIRHMVRSMSIAVGAYCLVVGLPYVLLWGSYEKALPSFVSSQDEVVVSDQSKRQQQWKLVLVILGLALLAMGVGLVLLVRAK